MSEISKIIQSLLDLESEAWNNQDAETLVSIFHPDMVWPWPENENQHDPAKWIFPQGRYNRERWKQNWNELFSTHKLIHNNREIIKIEISEERDGAFAVVDVDTLWENVKTGKALHWKGRACKGYTFVNGRWLLIFHTGLLDYSKNEDLLDAKYFY
jgi:ketosteroid isomerase-like protein